jgi:hypothetical protein
MPSEDGERASGFDFLIQPLLRRSYQAFIANRRKDVTSEYMGGNIIIPIEPLPDGNVRFEFFASDGKTINRQVVTGDVLRSIPLVAILTEVALQKSPLMTWPRPRKSGGARDDPCGEGHERDGGHAKGGSGVSLAILPSAYLEHRPSCPRASYLRASCPDAR